MHSDAVLGAIQDQVNCDENNLGKLSFPNELNHSFHEFLAVIIKVFYHFK